MVNNMKLLFTTIIFTLTVLNIYAKSPSNDNGNNGISPIRNVIKQIESIPLGANFKQVEKIFQKIDKKYAKLVKIPEGKYEKQVKEAVKGTNALNFVEDYFDQHFTVVNSLDDQSRLSLIYLNDFTLSYYFPIKKWNPKIQTMKFTFFGESLFEKTSQLQFNDVQEALVILRELKNRYSKPKVDESEINYKGKNYFLWENKKVRIEYQFEPAKDKFQQLKGYQGKIILTDLKNFQKAHTYIKIVKSKLLKLNGIVYPSY